LTAFSTKTKQNCFAMLLIAITIGALALRASRLDLRPMHGDEAVHAVKFNELWTTGFYRYDPREYHGPIIYYAALPIAYFSGARTFSEISETTLRLVPAILGAGLILLLWPLAARLGRKATLLAALLIAVSPALSFYARYYIQETPLVFFNLAAIVAALKYFEATSNRARTTYALLLGASVGAMHAAKETFVLAIIAALFAFALTVLWTRFIDHRTLNWRVRCRGRDVVVAIGAAIVVSMAFFSALGRNARGPLDSVLAYATYFNRAGGAETQGALHQHSFGYYLQLLGDSRLVLGGSRLGPWWSEALILLLAALGIIAALRSEKPLGATQTTLEGVATEVAPHGLGPRIHLHGCLPNSLSTQVDKRHEVPAGATSVATPFETQSTLMPLSKTLPRFLSFYALLLLLAYSLVPYKTPWCVLNFLLPFAILAGWGALKVLWWLRKPEFQVSAALLLSIGVAQLAAQSEAANDRFASDRRNPYVYAHPTNDVIRLGERLQALSALDKRGASMPVYVIGNEYWPLPWYARGLSQVGYFATAPARLDAAVLIVSPDQSAAILKQLGAGYDTRYQAEVYGLRPTVILTVYIERRLWQRFLKAQSKHPSTR